jgi:hypothetical protein
MRGNLKSAVLYIPPVLALLAIWYGLLFTGNTPGSSATDVLHFVLMEGPNPYWFRWLFALPILCAALGIAHISPIARQRTGQFCLLALGAALAIASWPTVSIEISVFVTIPVIYASLGLRKPPQA